MNYKNYKGEVADLEEIEEYNRRTSAMVFWSSSENTYQDWAGNWRSLDDIAPIVPPVIDPA